MTDTPRDDSATRARRQTCLELARELLLVGPDGEDLKLGYLHTLIDTGRLGATHHPRKKILVVGAGITDTPANGVVIEHAEDLDDLLDRLSDPADPLNAGPLLVRVRLHRHDYPRAMAYKVPHEKEQSHG